MKKVNRKEIIIELRSQGFTYSQITEKTGFSKELISYHCGKGVREKSLKRNEIYRKNNPLNIKYLAFISREPNKNTLKKNFKLIKSILKTKKYTFSLNMNTGVYLSMFTVEELIEKFGKNPTCYLTGRPIDLEKSKSYQLDHIIPRSRGGDNSLDNCGLSCSEANKAKNDLMPDEFFALCQEIIDYKNSTKKDN